MQCSVEIQVSVKEAEKNSQQRFQKSKVNCGPRNGLFRITMSNFGNRKAMLGEMSRLYQNKRGEDREPVLFLSDYQEGP